MLALGSVIPTFTGDKTGVPICDFFSMLEEIGKMGGWSDAQMLGMARCKMAGAAHDFAWRDEKVKSTKSFAEFKKLAFEHFDTEPRHVRVQRFRDAGQMVGEDVRTFASRLQRLARDTLSREEEGDQLKKKYAEDILKEEMTALFVAGLQDPVRRFVLSRKPSNFDQAVEAALDEEQNEALTTAAARVRVIERAVLNPEVALLTERLDRLEQLLSQQVERQVEARAQQRPFAGNRRPPQSYRRGMRDFEEIVCFACQGRGHIARFCQNVRRGEPQREAGETRPKQAYSGAPDTETKN